MSFAELFLLAVGLSMDAFAVAVCKGLAMKRVTVGGACAVGAWFGVFQALMPLLGWLLGTRFSAYITRYDHWIAFALLGLIGLNMIREALGKEEDEEGDGASLRFRVMLPLAIATSIDALAVGVTFAFLEVNVVQAVCFIGATTFVLSALGVKAGGVVGRRGKAKAEIGGGVILILLGLKILLEHTGVL